MHNTEVEILKFRENLKNLISFTTLIYLIKEVQISEWLLKIGTTLSSQLGRIPRYDDWLLMLQNYLVHLSVLVLPFIIIIILMITIMCFGIYLDFQRCHSISGNHSVGET